jgi:hypothetical protein
VTLIVFVLRLEDIDAPPSLLFLLVAPAPILVLFSLRSNGPP